MDVTPQNKFMETAGFKRTESTIITKVIFWLVIFWALISIIFAGVVAGL